MTYRLLLFLVLFTASCTKLSELQEQNLDASKKQTLYNVAYGSNSRHRLDIALPKNRTVNTPVVVFIHGGAWVLGDKGVFATEMQQFADAGIACASINYRYASSSASMHHPALPEDVRRAVDFIASKSVKWKVSPVRFGLVGHSAGGHLSLITAYTQNVDGAIKSCASWAGVTDLTDADQLAISGARDLFATYTGTSLSSVSDTLKYKAASPFWNIDSSTVSTLLVYATKDEAVPYVCGTRLQQKLSQSGVENEMVALQDAAHVWTGAHLTKARTSTLNWFKSKL